MPGISWRPAPAGTAGSPRGASPSSLDRELSDTGLSAAQIGLMAQIAAAEDDTLGALARRSGLEQSTLSRNLRTLESVGLIEIAVVETDLRCRAVWLTEAGGWRRRSRPGARPRRSFSDSSRQTSPVAWRRLSRR